MSALLKDDDPNKHLINLSDETIENIVHLKHQLVQENFTPSRILDPDNKLGKNLKKAITIGICITKGKQPPNGFTPAFL